MSQPNKSLFQQVFADWQRIPQRAWICALHAGLLSATIDVVWWSIGERPPLLSLIALLPVMTVWTCAIYLGVIGLLRKDFSFVGLVRFVFASLSLSIPIVSISTFMIIFRSFMTDKERLEVALFAALLCYGIISQLPAWPAALTVSDHFVSPIRVFKAMRGHRFQLMLVAYTAGIVGQSFLPKMSAANNIGEAALVGIGNAIFGLLTFGLVTSITVVALRFALINDHDLL